jgi:hypothetical protein
MKHVTSIMAATKPFDGFWMKSAYRIPLGNSPWWRWTTEYLAAGGLLAWPWNVDRQFHQSGHGPVWGP